MGILVAISPNSSHNRKSISILFAAAVEFDETAMMSFAIFCMLFGILVFFPENGEI